jgi:small subunit ribosomal protein S5
MSKVDISKIDQGKLREKVIFINRVSKVVKGGRRFGFSAIVGVGDEEGHVGVGMGKAGEVPNAIKKAIEHARKSLIYVPLNKRTMPFEIIGKFGAAKVLLKPAPQGTGIIAGGPVRVILELAGAKDVVAKSLGRTSNPFNVSTATMNCLCDVANSIEIGELRGVVKEEEKEENKEKENADS